MKVYNTLVVVTQIGQVEQCSAGCCPKGCAWNEVCAEVTGYVGVTGMATQTSPTVESTPKQPYDGRSNCIGVVCELLDVASKVNLRWVPSARAFVFLQIMLNNDVEITFHKRWVEP